MRSQAINQNTRNTLETDAINEAKVDNTRNSNGLPIRPVATRNVPNPSPSTPIATRGRSDRTTSAAADSESTSPLGIVYLVAVAVAVVVAVMTLVE
jgi:hypothetical protein